MAGILSQLPRGVLSPQDQGLMTLGLGLLASSGPSRTPQSLGQNLGQAGIGALSAYNHAQEGEVKRHYLGAQLQHLTNQDALLKAQIEAAKRKDELEQQRQAIARGLISGSYANAPQMALQEGAASGDIGPTVTNAARLEGSPTRTGFVPIPLDRLAAAQAAGVDTGPYLRLNEAAQPKIHDGYAYDPRSLRPGTFLPKVTDRDIGGAIQTVRRNLDGSETITGTTPRTAAPASLPFWLRRDAQGNSSLDPVAFNAQQGLARAGATRVDASTRQETEFSKAVGKDLGEMYSGLLKADMSAPSQIAKYQRLQSLLSQTTTGKFASTTTGIKAAAKGVGIDLSALGIADDVAPAQAAMALSNQLALELRSPAGGAGMPGAMSDADRVYLQNMVPSLESDPKAVPLMIEYRTRLAKREQEVAKKARAYRKRTGKFDDGFFDELAQWSDSNPLFPEATRANPAPAPKLPVPTMPQGFRVLR